jgi:hypothetical protein
MDDANVLDQVRAAEQPDSTTLTPHYHLRRIITMKLLIVTGYNEAYRPAGELCVASMKRYCDRYPGIRYARWAMPDDYGCHPSWYKLRVLRHVLPHHDYVLWVDADAMIVGDADLREVIQPATINIAKDDNGINHGVVAYKNCLQSFDAILRMELMHDEFKDHQWFEQAALMTFIDELDVHYQPKLIWNAYPREVSGFGDVCPQTLIVHWPGMSIEERVPWMSDRLKTLPL